MTTDDHSETNDPLPSDEPTRQVDRPDDEATTLPYATRTPTHLPDRVGSYRIIRAVGEGGMGAVYEAVQDSPRRTVALKVIRAGVAGPSLLRRFEHEAQILGRLDHPGIATIFEAGTFDAGAGPQPFFAMEFVNGRPVTAYANDRQLGTRDRLQLLARIAAAVQHAHQKGVIHRDLKPGNILVTEDGQVKVLDFGVARATDADIQTSTLRTDIGQLIGTIPYMSPEQAAGDPDELDTRSDVYALGVVAYELLAGRLPYDVGKKMIHEAVRVIREDDPTPLSSIDRVFRGDVEIIVGKALQKEKDRRYQSAGDLASDIHRYLDDEPIVARPPSTWYQLSKFSRRNKTLVAGIAAVLLVSIIGTVVSIRFAIGESRQRALAEANETEARTEAAKATQIADFTRGMLSGIDPETAGDLDKTLMRMVLDNAAARIGTELADQPEVEASIRMTIGLSYMAIGEYDAAEPHLEQTRTVRRRVLGDEHPSTLVSVNNLATLYWRQGRYDEAEPLHRRALETRQRVLGDEHPETLASASNLALLYHGQGRYDEAEPLYVRALETQQRVLGDEHPETLASANNLALLYSSQGRYDEAEPLYVRALETRQRVLGDEHPETLTSASNLGGLYHRQGRYDEAEPLYRRTLETMQRVLGDEHPDTLRSANNLASLYWRQGRYDEAEPLYRRALETQQRVLGDEHPSTLRSVNNLASLYSRQGRYDEAEPLRRRALETQQRVLGDEHPDTLVSVNNLANLYSSQGRYDEAEPLHRRALETQQRVLGDEHPSTLASVNNLASLYHLQGRSDEAEPLFLRALETRQRVLGDEHPDTLRSVNNLARLYAAQGRYESSRPFVRELLEHSLKTARAPRAAATAKNSCAWTLLTCEPADLRDPQTALVLALEANDMTEHANPGYLDTLSLAYHLTGDTQKAIENQKKAIGLLPPGESALRTGLEEALATFEAAGTDTDAGTDADTGADADTDTDAGTGTDTGADV